MQRKLKALIDYAEAHPERGYPTTLSALAAVLNASGLLGAGKLDGSRITKVATGERRFPEDIHAALLQAFGIGWPCAPYYDPQFGQDADPKQFQRMLAFVDGAIQLVRERRNETEFPLEEMYVLELRETPAGKAYCADVVAKLATIPIVGDEDPLVGIRIGEAGFSQVSIRAAIPERADVSSDRPSDWGAPSNYEVRNRSVDALFLWQARAGEAAAPYLDENIDVCRLFVTKFAEEDRLVIVSTAPLPELRLSVDPNLIEPVQQHRFQRIAQNQILDKYREGRGPVDGKKDVLRLGQIALRRRQSEE